MSARALTRSRHFRGRAQAERLDSRETIREKMVAIQKFPLYVFFSRRQGRRETDKVFTMKTLPRETLLPHIFFSKLIVFATIVNFSLEVNGS